ncbi:hypothetical protein V5O48_001950 [Marasmius crinis-equi]|uniref:Argonaute-like protein n=1 Tax=Marasmius crinis-equi TaxID=585013 RepID=A0ABR3FX27_9AGAR
MYHRGGSGQPYPSRGRGNFRPPGGPGQRGGRPGGNFAGASGGGTAVRTNCFEITTLPTREYHQYNVEIMPEMRDFTRRQTIIRKLETVVAPEIFSSQLIYDGRNLLYVAAALELPGASGTFNVSMSASNAKPVPGAKGTFQVRITKTQGEVIRPSRNPHTQTEINTVTNLVQLLIKQHPNKTNPHNARAYFTENDTRLVPNSGLELWRGYFQSVRPTIGRLLINVDTTIAAVYRAGPLEELAMQYLNSNNARGLDIPRSSPAFKALESFLKKVKIITKHTKRTKTIRALEPKAGEYKFTDRNGIEVSVAEYLQRAYNVNVQYKTIVGVNLSGPNSDHPEILPLELCDVLPGQLFRRKLPEMVTAAAVDFAKMKPDQRLAMVRDRNGPLDTYCTSEYIAESGMVINTTPITVGGRLLDAPSVLFQQPVDLKNGAWNVLRQRLNKPVSMNLWAAVSFVDSIRGDRLSPKMQELAGCCQTLGMMDIISGNGNNPEQALDQLLEAAGGQPRAKDLIILVVLPQTAAGLRARVKYWSDVRRGVRTQCFRESKIRGANNQYHNNIALKLNARLGGVNFLARSAAMDNFRREPSMILGADVGHPAPGLQRPSISSLVWSTDPEATKYSSTTRIQAPRLEYIADLQEMAEMAIRDFMTAHKVQPMRLIFFRDGVSEGEFETVARQEIEAIESVWKTKNIKNPPKLTYIIVGKRHHVAFFPEGGSQMNDINGSGVKGTGNCKPGFVVDRELANPFPQADFYLQSHAAIIGTSRSSHYTLIKDDNKIGQEGQELAFSLCHVYAKATRSVSIPAPVYYADLVCQRMAFHLPHESDFSFSDNASIASGSKELDLDAWKGEFKAVNDNVKRSMYFL